MKKIFQFISIFLFLTTLSLSALETTGSGIRVKKIAFVSVKVYSITHQMKDKSEKSASAVINADTDKKFILKMLRDVDSAKIVSAINDAFKLNGYNNTGNMNKFSTPLKGDLSEGDVITISYDSASKTTTCSYKGKSSSVAGDDFMKATWKIWFGKIDQPELTNQLMSKL
ncbi:MAG: chalcone isomerase family protein [Leptospiraceae bacterium]|nr:chalcone isomerase family protein [Leptospiraceae bacterium]MCP5512801.1 chalcone isomerase family protein [Leptospiraceae bacterium]